MEDDGIGFSENNPKNNGSFGLVGIGERVFNLGGEFLIKSRPGKGVVLTISIPMGELH